MCLNCGCMQAHDTMGRPDINIVYEDLRRAADANVMTVPATLAMIATTAAKDESDHPPEYGAQLTADIARFDDDGSPTLAAVPAFS